MSHAIEYSGLSRSFPAGDPVARVLLERAAPAGGPPRADGVLLLAGTGAGEVFRAIDPADWRAVAIELGNECLGVHTGEARGDEGSNVVGFARFRLGKAEPTPLVELVRQPATQADAIAAVRQVFEGAGLVVAVCGDFPGRIVDRLIRPYLNDALRRLDERLATADDLDTTLRLGLGYPEGPISLLQRTGLAEHYEVTDALHEALGDRAFAPARRAQVAWARRARGG